MHFETHSVEYFEMVWVTFWDFAENGAPHESTAHSGQVEGRAPGNSYEKPL